MKERPAGGTNEAPTVRRATPADAGSIARLTVSSWRAAYRGILPEDYLSSLRVEPRQAAWEEMLTRDGDGRTPAWVAEDERGVWGFVSCGPARDDDVPAPAGEIYALYVEPAVWRHGLGRSLLEAAADHCLAAGHTTLALWVLEENLRARAFYEALGWAPDGSRRSIELGGESAPEIRYRRRPD